MDILFILILIILVFNFRYNENFNTVGYNSNNITNYNNINNVLIYDKETTLLLNKFNKLFPSSNYNTDKYTLLNKNITFSLNTLFQNIISDYLKLNIKDILNNININNPGCINVYYKDVGKDRIFIFIINILNITNNISRDYNVKIKVSNISLYLDANGSGNYSLNNSIQNDINIVSIDLKLNETDFNVSPIDEYNQNYYELNNSLYLLDPFTTSHNIMVITNEMKNNFIKKLSLINTTNTNTNINMIGN